MKQPISEVYNGDCMDFMRDLPDGYFDLVVADPPYGINFENYERGGSGEKTRKRFTKIGKRRWDSESPKSVFFDELFRVSKNQIIWGGNYFWLPPTFHFIVWNKLQPLENFSDYEFAWTSFKKPHKEYSERNYGNGEKIHPTQKPIALYKYLLTNYAKPGQKIFDPMMGSQSSRIAAWDMGFDYYGCEKDGGYFRDGCARFEAHIKKPVLFAPEQMYNFEQAKLFE